MRKYTTLPYTEYPVAIGNYSETGRQPITQIIIHSTVAANLVAGNATRLFANNDATAYLAFEAEI